MTNRRATLKRAAIVIGIAGVAVSLALGVRLWIAWSDVERVAFDPETARDNLGSTTTVTYTEVDPVGPGTEDPHEGIEPEVEGDTVDDPDEFAVADQSASDEAMEVYLIIGSDQRPSLGESRRADVILVLILPKDGSNPVLTSLPRDLYLPNPCTGGMSRINANLNGCGDIANGPEQVAIAVEDFTGVAVDHFVVFTFDGFRNVVDRVGGVEVCPNTAVRDPATDPVPLDLPAGCSIADGYQALAWVRSRNTLGLVNGEWVPIAAGDLERNQRQQGLLVQALTHLSRMRDVTELTALVEDLASDFIVDEGLDLSEVVSTAWNLRSLSASTVARPVLPVANFVDPQGRWVLVPQATFASIVIGANPALGQYFAASG